MIINNIQVLRAFAAISVVAVHCLLGIQSYGFQSFNNLFFEDFGVDIFFVISGFIMVFIQNNYKTYLVDEFRTSCMCSICKTEIGRCEKFQIRENPKPYKSGNILVHGLLTCKKCSGVWNRDVNSATNIYRIAKNAINGLERPKYLCRKNKDENIKVEKPINEKIKKVVQKKAKKSVEVVALTNS